MDREVLKQYRALCREIAELQAERERLQGGILGAIRTDGLPGSNTPGDPVGNIAAKLAEIDLLLTEKINSLTAIRIEIEKALDSLSSSKERRLIRLRYIYGKSWDEIAAEMKYERRWIMRLHKKILQKIEIGH